MIARSAVVAEARSWMGTPYQHQARIKRVGVDCAGLVIGVARNLGLVASTFDVGNYSRQPDGVSLVAHCERWMSRIADAGALKLGDVIVVAFAADPNHLGIVADYYLGGRLSIIHALAVNGGRGGRVVEHRLDERTLARFVAGYRLPGVEP